MIAILKVDIIWEDANFDYKRKRDYSDIIVQLIIKKDMIVAFYLYIVMILQLLLYRDSLV
ncbi:hypothetical protein DXA17_19605 [Ruminococcus sp. AM58-7XD]|nr:hypothetical protein DXA17_19605 [Ruminococcus sp. AM58-7XD]